MRFHIWDIIQTSKHIIQDDIPCTPKSSIGTIIAVHKEKYTVVFPLRFPQGEVITRDLLEDQVTEITPYYDKEGCPTEEETTNLWHACAIWRDQHKPRCAESIYQVDSVQEGLPDLAERVCDIIGYYDKED